MQDLIAVGVKTHFIYYVVAKNNGYKQPLPDVLEDRPGQMDAFGIASGLVAIHTRRPDNSFLEFVRRDNPKSPIFTGFSKANGLPADVPGMTDAVTDPKAAADRIFKNIPAWAPPVPAPIDIKSVNWAVERYHANWDGNQGASSRTLASGASATGDPRMVNVRIHEPLNPFIDNLPPPPYPFASVDLARARRGQGDVPARSARRATSRGTRRSIRRRSSASIRTARWSTPACRATGWRRWSPRRARSTASTTRVSPAPTGACRRATGRRGSTSTSATRRAASPKAPTATRRTCCTASGRRRRTCTTDRCRRSGSCSARPRGRRGSCAATCTTTRRWSASSGRRGRRRATARTRSLLVKEYDTTVAGKANTGHTFGAGLCPDTSGLDPVRDRAEIETRMLQSPVGRAARVPEDALIRRATGSGLRAPGLG